MNDVKPSEDEARLAKLGYKQEFKRHFTIIETFGLAFCFSSVVPGIASVMSLSIPNGGPVAMVWGWFTASIFIFIVSLAMAELGSAAPTSGGLYYWTHRFASPKCRNLLAWIVGYCNTMEFIAATASVAWAIAVDITAIVTLSSNPDFAPTNGQLFGMFTAILFVQGMLACFATKLIARMQWFFIVANLALVLGLIISLGKATPAEFRNDKTFVFTTFENSSGWPNGFAFILAFLSPTWTIAGFDGAVHISEEARNANIAVPWAMVMTTIISGVLGFCVNIVLAFFMGSDLDSILAGSAGQPMATILLNGLNQRGMLAFFWIIIVVLFFTGVNVITVVSRQIFAFARDGALPFSPILYRINPHSGTPINAVWFATTLAFILGFLAFAGPVAINSVFTLFVGAQNIAYAIPIASRFLFKNDFKPGPFTLGRMGLPVAIVAVSWLVFVTVVFLFPATPQVDKHTMNYTVVVLAGWIILSLVFYYFPVYGGVHYFKGPRPNLPIEEPKKEEHDSSSSRDEKGEE